MIRSVVQPMRLRAAGSHHRIAIVGTGYVGLVTGTCLAHLGHSVVCLDNDRTKIAMLQREELPFFEPQLLEMIVENRRAGRLSFSDDVAGEIGEAGIVCIAVGTPIAGDDTIDLSSVRSIAVTIGAELRGPKIVIVKSTVPVGTCEMVAAIVAENAAGFHHVEVVSNPEFLREGSAVADFMFPDRIVLGTSSPQAAATVRSLYAKLDAPFFTTDVRTSEMIKYAANSFLATKVSFMNEIANICELVGVDVKDVGFGIGLDHRIGTHHMSAGIGYGGSCFPKDLRGLELMAAARGYDAGLLRSVAAVNRGQIDRTLEKIEDALGGSLAGKRVCVLGLSFKPNTSDVREAPALYLIDLLLRCGAEVTAHDPVAIESARARGYAGVTYCADPYVALRGCDALVLATEWGEYAALDFAIVAELMRGNVVFDGRGFFDPEQVVVEGLWYLGVGRVRPAAPVRYLEALGE